MKKILICACLAIAAASSLYAQKKECYVIKADGTQQRAYSIKVRDASGSIDVVVDPKMPAIQYTRNGYRYAFIPKPQPVEQISQMLDAGKNDEVAQKARGVYNMVKFVGWGDYVASCEVEALLALGRPTDAQKALTLAKSTPGANRDAVVKAEILCLLQNKEYSKVDAYLKQLMTSKDDKDAAFAFNMRGQVYLAQGQKKQAVLEYLKTVLLFDSKKLRKERAEAKKQAIAIMKELKDPRVSKIEALD